LAALSCRVIVPGHGPPGTCADVDRLRDYLETVGRVARQSLGRGDTLEVAMQQFPLDRFAMWTEPERLRMNLFSAMRQLQGNHDPLSPQELIRVIHDAA
jgi:cyclase